MISNNSLTSVQQKNGRKFFNLFNFTNGLSYICVGETIIILFAIRMGCPDYCIAVIGSLFFLSNFFMPLGKTIMARIGAVKTISLCWWLRNTAILLLAAAPLFSYLFSPVVIPFIFIAVTSLFYSCRSVGLIGFRPIMKSITTPENRGNFSSISSGLFYLANLIMLALVILVMSISRSTGVFIGIIVFGAGLGLAATLFMSRIEEPDEIRISARQPIFADMLLTLSNPMRLRQLAANCVVNSAIALTVPISMLALKKGYGIDDNLALYFSLLQILSSVAISYVLSMLAGVTGPRPLAILFYCLMIFLCLFWVLAPADFRWYYMICPFILGGAAVIGVNASMTHYFLNTIPGKEQVAASLSIYAMAGLISGFIGSFIGGGLLEYLSSLAMPQMQMFKLYFLFIMGVLILGLILVIRLKPVADWRVGRVLSLLIAPRDMITLFTLNRIKLEDGPERESENINRLHKFGSDLSEESLLSFLDSPKFSLRGRAITALRDMPLGEHAVEVLLRELEEGEYTTAYIAAEIAGDKKLYEAVEPLRNCLNSRDFYLQGKSMLALTKLDDRESFPVIKRIFKETDNPRLIIHGSAAMTVIDDEEGLRLLLEKAVMPELPQKVLYEIIYCITLLLGQGDEIYKFLKIFSKDRSQAMELLLATCGRKQIAGKETGQLISAFVDRRITESEIIGLLVNAFRESDNPKHRVISEFLISHPAGDVPQELLLSLLPAALEASTD